MRLISRIFVRAALALALPVAPALAQPKQAITVGMQVTDTTGGPVGTVTSIQGDNLLVKTDKHEALLPKAGFTPNAGKGLGGTEIGKIDSVTNSDVVIALPSGKKVQLARTGVRGNPDGTVTVGLTSQQLDAQVQSREAPKSE